MIDIAASDRCKWPAATGSCKCPHIGGSVQTRSLQVDLLQVPIHRPDHHARRPGSLRVNVRWNESEKIKFHIKYLF